jgi:hypothetical protein
VKPLHKLCIAVLIAGCGNAECGRKPIPELKQMSRDSLLFELCSAAAGTTAALRDSTDASKCLDYTGTIINVLRKDHKVEVTSAYRKGLDVGVTACLEEAKARGLSDAGKGGAPEKGTPATIE